MDKQYFLLLEVTQYLFKQETQSALHTVLYQQSRSLGNSLFSLKKLRLMMKNIKIFFFICLISCFLILPCISATVTFNQDQKLYFDNGSYVILPAGTYNSVEKTNNVWFVNGIVYP